MLAALDVTWVLLDATITERGDGHSKDGYDLESIEHVRDLPDCVLGDDERTKLDIVALAEAAIGDQISISDEALAEVGHLVVREHAGFTNEDD